MTGPDDEGGVFGAAAAGTHADDSVCPDDPDAPAQVQESAFFKSASFKIPDDAMEAVPADKDAPVGPTLDEQKQQEEEALRQLEKEEAAAQASKQ